MPRKRPALLLLPRKQPAQARAQRTYRAILQAGARILERDGYEALTTNHVAELAGVGIASLYEYFPHKQALVAEVVSHVLDGVLADLQESSLRPAPAPAGDAVRAWIAAMFAAVQKRRGVVAVIMREVPFLWEIPAVERARTRLFDLASASRTLWAAALGIPPLPDATLYLLTVMTGAAILEAVLRPPPHQTQDSLISAVAEIVNSTSRGAAASAATSAATRALSRRPRPARRAGSRPRDRRGPPRSR